MKNLLGSLVLLGSLSALADVVECSGLIEGKKESMKIRLNAQDMVVFYSETKIVEAKKGSYFGWLSSVENFGLEGQGSFIAPNGYRILRVLNTAEAVEIGVSEDHKTGFYNYRDNGSGTGNVTLTLKCKDI